MGLPLDEWFISWKILLKMDELGAPPNSRTSISWYFTTKMDLKVDMTVEPGTTTSTGSLNWGNVV